MNWRDQKVCKFDDLVSKQWAELATTCRFKFIYSSLPFVAVFEKRLEATENMSHVMRLEKDLGIYMRTHQGWKSEVDLLMSTLIIFTTLENCVLNG